MPRWFPLRVSLLAVTGLALLIAGYWLSLPKKEPTAGQILARPGSQQATIVVGPNVQVSRANFTIQHRETLIAADPLHPERLFAVSMRRPHTIVGYRSEDGGRSWQPAFENQVDPREDWSDPALAFGPDGTLFLVCMRTEKNPKGEGRGSATDPRIMAFYASPDAGKNWKCLCRIERPYMDRPWLAIDGSRGPYRGRIYCASYSQSLALDVSAHEGTSFTTHTWPIEQRREWFPSPPAVLSDGTLVLSLRIWSGNPSHRPEIRVLLSEDGGQTLRAAASVPTYWYDERIKTSNFWFFPQLAVDSVSVRNRDRVYALWEDGSPPDLVRVLFAFSTDKGKTWIGPTILSEQPAGKVQSADYGAYMPSIGINKDGLVAVSWYDRRGLPVQVKDKRPPGCNVRLHVSLDGGETWQRSVQVNEQTIKAPIEELGETAGIAADAAGIFHPVWIDDRTGTRQVWTSTIKVER